MNNNLKPIETLRPFTRLCMTIGALPSSYLISMTYEEQLLWFCNYLEKTVIPTINNNGLAVEELQNLYIQLKEYVDNYFDNLDIQEEINNKLDEMAEDGTLENLIGQYLELMTTYTYNNVNEMKLATNLVNGSFAKTNGYYQYGDGGASYYKVRTITNSDVPDDKFLIALADEYLVAELYYINELNILQIGAKVNDNTFNNSDLIQLAIDKLATKKNGKVYLPAGNIYCEDTITLKSNVSVIGSANTSTWSSNADLNYNTDTIINFNPSSLKSLFILDTDNRIVGYVPNICLKNMYILNPNNYNEYCNYALYLDTPAKSIFENLNIVGFNTNIYIKNSMEVDFNNVYSIGAKTSCCYVDYNYTNNEYIYNTTTNFINCYFGQTIYYADSNYGGGNPLTIKHDSCENFNFINCIFESSDLSIIIEDGNSINFNNIYVENIPSSTTNPSFKIGEIASTISKNSILNFFGGMIMGSVTQSPQAGSTLFNVDYCAILNINGCELNRSDKVIKATSNTGLITYMNNKEENIAHNFRDNLIVDNLKDKAIWLNCKNDSSTYEHYQLPKQTLSFQVLTSFANGWSAYQYGVQYYKFGNMVYFEFNAVCGTNTPFSKVMDIPNDLLPTQPVFMKLRDRSDLNDSNSLLIDPTNSQLQVSSNANLVVGHVYQASIIYWVY